MNDKLREIEILASKIEEGLFNTMQSYTTLDEMCEDIIKLGNLTHVYSGNEDTDELWALLECGNSGGLDNLIIGLYWALTEWHAGQASVSYAAMCALGKVFKAGGTSTDEDDDTYKAFNDIAESGFPDISRLSDTRKMELLRVEEGNIKLALRDHIKWYEDHDPSDDMEHNLKTTLRNVTLLLESVDPEEDRIRRIRMASFNTLTAAIPDDLIKDAINPGGTMATALDAFLEAHLAEGDEDENATTIWSRIMQLADVIS